MTRVEWKCVKSKSLMVAWDWAMLSRKREQSGGWNWGSKQRWSHWKRFSVSRIFLTLSALCGIRVSGQEVPLRTVFCTVECLAKSWTSVCQKPGASLSLPPAVTNKSVATHCPTSLRGRDLLQLRTTSLEFRWKMRLTWQPDHGRLLLPY